MSLSVECDGHSGGRHPPRLTLSPTLSVLKLAPGLVILSQTATATPISIIPVLYQDIVGRLLPYTVNSPLKLVFYAIVLGTVV